MRILEFFPHPIIVITGWIFAIIALMLIARKKSELSNQEISNLAALGAFVFFVQSLVILPINLTFVPVLFTLSGVMLVVTIAGPTRGIIISASAMILNHFLIPGSLSMLGINVSNMIITSLLIGWLPSQIYYNPYSGKRLRYLGTFTGGLLYTLIEGTIIYIELILFFESSSDLFGITIAYFATILVLSLIEGVFTAIAASYYYRTFIAKTIKKVDIIDYREDENIDSPKDKEIQKIYFNLDFINDIEEVDE